MSQREYSQTDARRGAEGGIAYAGGLTDTPTGTDVNDGNWHHFVAISDPHGAEFGTALYVDGNLDTIIEGAAVLTLNSGNNVMIGENPDARGRNGNGNIDDIGIWNRVLTTDEISALYAGGAGKALSSFFAPEVDTDKDGLPDWWETRYALNINDASDAAKDNNGNGITNADEFRFGLDPNDKTTPKILSAVTSGSFDSVTLMFSKPLDPATAAVASNYTINPSLAITGVTYKNRVVTLTTAKQPADSAYSVTVKGIKDVSRFEVAAADSTVNFYAYTQLRTGVLKFAYWADIAGTPVDNLWADLRFPDSPDEVKAVFSFNSRDAFPDDSHENYGAMIEGYLTPTESGQYDFFIRSDDASEFYISTDDKEANLQWAAEETGCCNAFVEPGVSDATTFAPINLTAGKKYFVRLIYKEGGGGDYGQVAWRKVGDATPAASLTPIPGIYLSSAIDLPAPAEGAFVTQTPGPNSTGASPVPQVTIVHRDGKTAWTAANVSLKVDGTAVTPEFSKVGNVATLSYKGSGLFASGSEHTITLGYSDPVGKPATTSWSFTAAEYKGPVLDSVGNVAGLIKGTADNSAFWADSPSSNGSQRGFQAHTPWSNNAVYFDTAGCCDGVTQRISAGIDTFPGYSGDVEWWNEWHHFAFTKKDSHKEIWIDGQLFLDGENTGVLPSDFTQIWLGAEGGGPATGTTHNLHGLLDDYSVYATALSGADIGKLAAGDSPTTLAASTKMIAYWDFNKISAPSAPANPANGLVAYWNFDGNLQDSVKAYHGTARGANPVAFEDGKAGFGKAIKLDGGNFVEITGGEATDLNFPGGSMSIGGWFKVGTFDKDWQALISKGEGSNYRVARRGGENSVAYAGGVGEGTNDAPDVNDGNWHHFVAVSDATAAAFGTALYIDGAMYEINATAPVLTAGTARLFIGENPEALNRQWNGSIDDIALWNRVLTSEEVALLYNGGAGTALSAVPGVPAGGGGTADGIGIARTATGITLTFQGTLQSSDSITGPFTDVPGATSPATIPFSGTGKFYRFKQ